LLDGQSTHSIEKTIDIDERIKKIKEKLEHFSKLDDDDDDNDLADKQADHEKGDNCKHSCGKFIVDEDFEIFKKKIVKKAEVIIECYKKKLIKCEKDKCLLEKTLKECQEKNSKLEAKLKRCHESLKCCEEEKKRIMHQAKKCEEELRRLLIKYTALETKYKEKNN